MFIVYDKGLGFIDATRAQKLGRGLNYVKENKETALISHNFWRFNTEGWGC